MVSIIKTNVKTIRWKLSPNEVFSTSLKLKVDLHHLPSGDLSLPLAPSTQLALIDDI